MYCNKVTNHTMKRGHNSEEAKGKRNIISADVVSNNAPTQGEHTLYYIASFIFLVLFMCTNVDSGHAIFTFIKLPAGNMVQSSILGMFVMY